MARIIVSHRLAGQRHPSISRAALENALPRLRTIADVRGDSQPESITKRRVIHLDADPVELHNRRHEFGDDVIIEHEILRRPVLASVASDQFQQAQGLQPPPAGIGSLFSAQILAGGHPLEGASVTLILASKTGAAAGTRLQTKSGSDGKVSLAYSPAAWTPSLLLVEPLNGVWQGWQTSPQSGLVMDLPLLPKAGPLGWWHQAAGMVTANPDRGAGIRVGVIDTGVGPHPYLSHVKRLGSVIAGVTDSSPDASKDSDTHGTHVCGIVGSRPVAESGDYAGIAIAAELMCIRVFPPGGGANQGDIAEAIDQLATVQQADLINMSLGSEEPSEIEHDAILAALEQGTLCFCSAGNGYGQPLMYPAAYPEAVSVGALGLFGVAPAGTEAAGAAPTQADRFGPNGLFVANFSNIGAGLVASAAGVGIISTVPVRNSVAAPYLDMSGTSMASPVACASLATLLSHDQAYRALPRSMARAQHASAAFVASLRSLGLNQAYAGRGLAQASRA